MTLRLSEIPVRAGVALVLAALIHFSAWQTLAGIHVLLPREALATTIDVALLPAAPAPAMLPLRRAVVRIAAPPPRTGEGALAPLTAVRIAPGRTAHPGSVGSKRRTSKEDDEKLRKSAAAAAAAAAAPDAAATPAPAAQSQNQPELPPAAPPAQVAAQLPTPPTSTPATPAVQPEASPPAKPETPSAAAPAQGPAAAGSAQLPTVPAPPSVATSAASASPEPAAAVSAKGSSASQIASAAAPALPAPSHAPVQVVLPKSARFVYDSYGTVRVGGFVLGVRGRTTTRWKFQDGHYQSDLSIDVVNFSESSRGRFDPDFGLEPERYSEIRPHRPIATAQFDWTKRRVSFTEDKQQDDAEPGTQDRLSVQFQLSVLRQVYPERFVRGASMPITLAGTHDISHWTFTVTGEDIVDSGLGHLPALRVLSNRTTAAGRESLEVWISEKLDWFPARIRMVDKNGNLLDFVVDEATID
ncbi:MAG: DUF3108 domain-containing protein [Burkholderiaceae bacterium]|nr:DUF3108 domain-containing protein [Burkholderiaceae bacterium]